MDEAKRTHPEYALADAKTHLTEIVREAEAGAAVRLTRRGKPVAVLLSVANYERLANPPNGDWLDAVELWRAEPGGLDLTDDEIASWRDRAAYVERDVLAE